MNCLEFRRRMLSDPGANDEALSEHRAGCAECARFATDMNQFEATLKQASQTAVPEGLASRILLRQRLAEQQKNRRTTWFALAASILFGFVVVLGIVPQSSDQALQEVVLRHINDELNHLQDRKNVSMESLNKLLRAHGAQFQTRLDRVVHYAGACQIRKNKGAHMVVESQAGPLTVLFMPGENIVRRKLFNDARFKGVILPVENGSMAIIGDDEKEINQLEQQLKSTLKFIS